MKMRFRTYLFILSFAITLAGSAFSSDKIYWQLLVSYDQNGINIIEAGPIPPATKQIRTPGIDGAPVRVGYDLEWLDGSSSVIAATTAEMPLGVRTCDFGKRPCQRAGSHTGSRDVCDPS